MRTNKIITILFSLIIISHLSSCDLFINKKIEPVSEISTYPIFVFNGGQTMVHTIGNTWSDPGVLVSEVKEGDNDLAHTLVVDDSEMDINTRGLYTLKYTATNSYGYESTVNRFVLVTEDVTNLYNISGTYYQGFYPIPSGNNKNTMDVTIGDVMGFWKIENIRDLSQKIEGEIADLGDQTYVVAMAYLKRKISNLRYVYLKGEAEFDDISSPKTLTVKLYKIYENGDLVSPPDTVWENSYIWKKIE